MVFIQATVRVEANGRAILDVPAVSWPDWRTELSQATARVEADARQPWPFLR
jgi:hypothetical protein